MSEYSLVKIDCERRHDFIIAWETAFSRKLDQSIYDWIFNDKNIMYGLLYDGSIVAGYCLYPLSCYWKEKESVALLCNNVFVCPDHQGKHLFVKISKAALKDASEKGYGDVAYGIPNSLALPGHKRVGWGIQEPVHFLEKITSNKLGIENKNNWFLGSMTKKQRAEVAKCSKLSAMERGFSIIKTESFLQWRYESKPGVKYWFGLAESNGQVLAYCVCKYYPDKQVLHFIDIDGIRDDLVSSLVSEAERIPESFTKINVWSSTAKKEAFLKNGYFISEECNNLILMDIKSVESEYLSTNFNLCLGDNDVY